MRISRTKRVRRQRGALFVFMSAIAAIAITAGAALGIAWLWYEFSDETLVPAIAAVVQEDSQEVSRRTQPRTTPGLSAASSINIRVTPIERPPFPYARAESYERADIYHFADSIFFGDSITAAIPFYGFAPGAAVMAFAGDNPVSINERKVNVAGELLSVVETAKILDGERGHIYIMFSALGLTPEIEQFIEGYEIFIDLVEYSFPDARIFIQSIPPITYAAGLSHQWPTNEIINEYNLALMDLARQRRLIFLDIASALTDETGHLSPKASPADGIHLSAEYYYIWFDYLKRHW